MQLGRKGKEGREREGGREGGIEEKRGRERKESLIIHKTSETLTRCICLLPWNIIIKERR